ncbi:hypothetical protein HYDPIDRAFT_27573 [Hydnomerulius pinastri MD-312]|nr:hypothetical protein HYDPIDRAFT_27573 [Hydnomerulius pinastri MD-312]
MFGRILLILATVSLFHGASSVTFFASHRLIHSRILRVAAYSTYEHLSRLKALGKPEGSLPLNTVYESIFALILGILGASLNSPPLKDITWASEMKKRTIDEMDSRLGFANYQSRGKSFLAQPRQGQS